MTAARRPVAKSASRPKPGTAVAEERRLLFKALHPVVEMLGSVIGPNVEVVLHDLSRPERSVVAIANGHVSNRRVGHSVISGPKDDKGFLAAKQQLSARGEAEHTVIGVYTTQSPAGQPLRSSTVVFRDAEGQPFAALCLNADLSVFEAAHAWLERLLEPVAAEAPAQGEPPALDALMKEVITDAVRRLGKPLNLMTKEEKIQAVQAMMQRGLFIVKGGVERAAAALGVTRFTVYNYLETLRERSAAAAPEPAPAAAPRRRAGTRGRVT